MDTSIALALPMEKEKTKPLEDETTTEEVENQPRTAQSKTPAPFRNAVAPPVAVPKPTPNLSGRDERVQVSREDAASCNTFGASSADSAIVGRLSAPLHMIHAKFENIATFCKEPPKQSNAHTHPTEFQKRHMFV